MTREEAIAILRQEREDICTDMQCAMTMYRDYSGVDKCNRDCEEREAYDMAIEALQAEPNEVVEQEPKILDTIDFAIDASNGGTNYYVGFRNGLRYAKSLVDGAEPQFENCAEQEPVKHGKWEKTEVEGGKIYICSECSEAIYKSTFEENVHYYCNNCGAKMDKE